jgi:hypothetical protein
MPSVNDEAGHGWPVFHVRTVAVSTNLAYVWSDEVPEFTGRDIRNHLQGESS